MPRRRTVAVELAGCGLLSFAGVSHRGSASRCRCLLLSGYL